MRSNNGNIVSEFVHDTCLQNYLHSDMRIPRQCSMCLGTASYPEVRNEHDRRQGKELAGIIMFHLTSNTVQI